MILVSVIIPYFKKKKLYKKNFKFTKKTDI